VLLSTILVIVPLNIDPAIQHMASINLMCVPAFCFTYILDITTHWNPIVLPLPLTLKDWAFLCEIVIILFFLYSGTSIILDLFGIDITLLFHK
jgi:hypothetical protein